MLGIKINHTAKAIEITKGFDRRTQQDIESKEFETLAKYVEKLPNYNVVIVEDTAKRDTLTLNDIEKNLADYPELLEAFKAMKEEKVLNSKGKAVKKYGFFQLKKWYKEEMKKMVK